MAPKNEEAEADVVEAKPKRNMMVIVLVAVNVVVIGGAVAAVLLLRGGGAPPAPAAAAEAEEAGSAEPGPMFHFDPFVVNLSDPGEAHYLKVSVSLELANEAASTRFEPRKTQARDAVLMTLSSLTVSETRDVDGREQLRQRLKERLDEVVGPRQVKSVYFTDFVTQ